MTIYRAMCHEEMVKTINNGYASFDTKRYKWFSQNLEFIVNRVMDKKFNNSKFKSHRYTYLLEFEWNGNNCDFISTNEIQFDRRKNPKIKFVKTLLELPRKTEGILNVL